MKKRKNKFIPLIVLIVILAALMIGYSVLASANDRREAEQLAEEEAANAVTLIAEYDYTTVTELSYQAKGSDPITFTQSAGVWAYTGDAHFPLNQTIPAQMAYAISTIAVEAVITEGEAADYGLDDPAYTIRVSYADGNAHTYKIGDYNSFNASYYFSMDGSLYMVAEGLLPYFQYELNDLLALDTLPAADWADNNYVMEITVRNGEASNVISDDAGRTGTDYDNSVWFCFHCLFYGSQKFICSAEHHVAFIHFCR